MRASVKSVLAGLLAASSFLAAECAAADAGNSVAGRAAAPSQGPATDLSASQKAGTAIYSQGRCAKFTESEPASAVIFFVVALLLGLISYHLLAWVPVPYTAILLVSVDFQLPLFSVPWRLLVVHTGTLGAWHGALVSWHDIA